VTKPIIEFQHVEYLISTIPSRSILSDVSLQIYLGETIALLGRSGSGKTTLLKLINGLRFPSSGTVQIQDRSIRDWDPHPTAAFHRLRHSGSRAFSPT
jgi:ABC-type Fe3+/spermidine/putrescine transport system ATPase subunit